MKNKTRKIYIVYIYIVYVCIYPDFQMAYYSMANYIFPPLWVGDVTCDSQDTRL